MLSELILGGVAGGLAVRYLLADRIQRLESRVALLERRPAQEQGAAAPGPGIALNPLRGTPDERGIPAPASRPVVQPPDVRHEERVLELLPVVRTTPVSSRPEAAAAAIKIAAPVVPPSLIESPRAEPSALAAAVTSLYSLVMANPFASLGMLLVLVSVGFLFSLLAASNILPPALRVFLVGAAASAVFMLGLRQEKERPALGVNLQGGALAAHFLCALWAYQGYGLIGATGAFAWMGALSSAAMAWAALRRRGLFAFMGLAGALVTPVLANTGSGEFSGLALYCTWVSAMGLAVAARLRMPTLASAALAGVSFLLGAALHLGEGSHALAVIWLVAMYAGFTAAAVLWVRGGQAWRQREVASIAGLLLGAPLVFAGFLSHKTGLPDQAVGALLGVSALVYLAHVRGAASAWRAWLMALGALLGILAIGVGLEGATRGLAFSASALALVLLSETLEHRLAPPAAMAYWALSLLVGMDELQAGHQLPLLISGAVAVAAGFVMRKQAIGYGYTMLAPLVLFLPLQHPPGVPHVLLLAWFLGWAGAVTAVQRVLSERTLSWPALQLSALWALPAGAVYLLGSTMPATAGAIVLREAALLAWTAMSVLTVYAMRSEDALERFMPRDRVLAAASLAIPLAASLELVRFAGDRSFASATLFGSLALAWAVWTNVAAFATRRRSQNFQEVVAGGAAVAAVVMTALLCPPNAAALLQWPAVGLLLLSAHMDKTPGRHSMRWAWGVLAGTVLAQALQSIGAFQGMHLSTLQLVFQRAMQPWVSLLWAAGAISVVLYAAKAASRRLWIGGGLAVLALALKMLLVDLSTLSLTAKVGVFLVTGVAFIVLGRFSPTPPQAAAANGAAPC